MANIKLIGIGRNSWNGVLEVPDDIMLDHDEVAARIYDAVRPHIMSICFEVLWDGKKGTVVAGGFHNAGDLKLQTS